MNGLHPQGPGVRDLLPQAVPRMAWQLRALVNCGMTYSDATYGWVKMAALIDDACASLCDARGDDDPLVNRIWRLGSNALLMAPMPHVALRDAYKVLPRAVGDPRDLLLRAEELTRSHPVEAFPPGASAVIVELIDLARELSARR